MPIESLTADQIDFFNDQGYVLLPGLIEPNHRQRLIAEVEEMVAHRSAGDNRMIVSYDEMGMLTSHPPVIAMVEQLMGGTPFSMHHIHSARHEPGDEGIGWHQDYEQIPQTNRTHLMVHVFYYLSGMNGEIGDLLVLPRSQYVIAQRDLRMLDSIDLPGSVCIDDLEPGSAVVVHSAVWHTRRPKPGGDSGPRYFVDVSYCQHGTRWPGYGNVDEINATALEMGLDRDGRYAYLYDGSCFFEREGYTRRLEELNQGSFVQRLLDGDG